MTLLPKNHRTKYCFTYCGKEICECKPTKKIQMNKEKTAMQMLIEAMQKGYDSIDGSESRIANVQKSEVGLRISQAKYLLKKEQEQIEKAFYAGVTDVFDSAFDKDDVKGSGKDYYRSKYGGEDEVAP